jgi:hypothetical protein
MERVPTMFNSLRVPAHREELEHVLGRGLRVLLRYRVPQSQVDSTCQRILDVVAVRCRGSLSIERLTAAARDTMNEIAPRPAPSLRGPPPKGLTLIKIRGELNQCTATEKEILTRRYARLQRIDEIALSLQTTEDKVRDTLSRVREWLLPWIK